jgi:hypothetical protein
MGLSLSNSASMLWFYCAIGGNHSEDSVSKCGKVRFYCTKVLFMHILADPAPNPPHHCIKTHMMKNEVLRSVPKTRAPYMYELGISISIRTIKPMVMQFWPGAIQ